MKKFFIFISVIIYTILIAILYRNYTISNLEFYFDYQKINSVVIVIILIVKIVLDLLVFIKKENNLFKKLANIYIFIIFLLFIFFIPKAESESKLLNKNLKTMLNLNQIVFSGFNSKENKLPQNSFFENLKTLDLGDSIYLKKGNVKHKYKIKIKYDDYPVLNSKNLKPGTFFIVVSKKNSDFYITASILDPLNKKPSMLSMNGEIIVLNKNINIDELKKRKQKMELARKLYINLKKK